MGLTACNPEAKLAKDLEGSWTGAPEKLADDANTSATCIPVYTFVRSENESGGTVTIDALISTAGNTASGAIGQVSLSASGKATVNGKWRATDDDEIFISLEPTSLQVSVDPEAVEMAFSPLSGNDQPAVDSLKPAMIPVIRTLMTTAMQRKLVELNKIDDIKIKNDIMTCEIGKRDLSFHRTVNP
ncbi:MAG: hypothetical protein K2L49_08915 [Muribaculaceae bacterium]|nr:hypothetical protein [Muribaculaceae bacterium]